ncbi:UNVERIFIED_CONTAM: hypothetical protein RMT77_000346 [Armadillidium vulgare]
MSLGILDKILLAFSVVATLVIGIYHGVIGFKQTSVDYMIGGRMMKPVPLAMSLTVGTVSAITIMGNAGEIYTYGTQFWIMDIGIAAGMFIVAKFFIPILYPLNFISIYNYIESRFKSVWLRRCTVFLTLGGAYLFTGFLLLPPAIFLKSFTGLDIKANIVITGLACSFYSSIGGVKAVVYTDVLQSVIMITGSLAIVIQGSIQVGGINKVWDIAQKYNRIEFFNFDPNPFQRHSFWLVIVNGLFFSLSTYGVNQSQTQRAFSSGSVSDAQRVIYLAIVGILLLRGFINFSGLVIFANYATCDPLTKNPTSRQRSNIEVVVIYVLEHLTGIPGLAGLFVASIYAAVLSSVSTQVNSLTALLWEDFLKEVSYFRDLSDVKTARFQKVIVILNGILGVLTSLILCKFISFLEFVLKITGAIWGPMVGLFFIGMFLPWINVKGASLGFLGSVLVSLWIVTGQLIVKPDEPFLPMSHEGCLHEINEKNASSFMPFHNSSFENTLIKEMQDTEGSEATYGIYGISYCLNYLWGFFTCIIVAILFTVTTGSNFEDEVDKKLIHAGVWEYFSSKRKRNCGGCNLKKRKKKNNLKENSSEEETKLSV